MASADKKPKPKTTDGDCSHQSKAECKAGQVSFPSSRPGTNHSRLTILPIRLRFIQLVLIFSLIVISEKFPKQIALRPNDTVDRFTRGCSNRANRVRLGSFLDSTVETLGSIFLHRHDLAKITLGAGFD